MQTLYPDNMTASKIDEISWHEIVLEFFKTYCVEETSLFNLLWIQPLRWLLDIEVSWSFCHGRTAWWPLCWQEDPVPGSLVLWLICHHLQFSQLKVTLAMKYLLLFSIVLSHVHQKKPKSAINMLTWYEDWAAGSLVLWLTCHHLQFSQLKVTLAMKYFLFQFVL